MKHLFQLILLLTASLCLAQKSIPQVLEKLNKKTVPYVTSMELKSMKSYVILDSREPEEYAVSHIKNAMFVGYNKFDSDQFVANVPDKAATLVVYCSLGVRSENIGEKLQKLGYKNVLNLYGGIFDWKDSGGKVYNSKNNVTDSIHTFNKRWGSYLKRGIKVY